MGNLEGKQHVNGILKNTVDVVFLSEGRLHLRGYTLFAQMTLNSIFYPIHVQTLKGENVEITKIFMEDRHFIQITVDDIDPIYCNPDEFAMELKSSIAVYASY